jgi:class 3 adenylate cyclase
MQATYSVYKYTDSLTRIDELLAGSDASYQENKGIPGRDSLTFSNGYYVDVTVLFIDMRGSKALSERHNRPVLAKIYRAYISELVAVFRGNSKISEIYIEGDGLWAVFDTRTKVDVDEAFKSAYTAASLIDILNVKLKRKGYSTISVGIGLDDGESLFIKAGYKGSGINEVVWLGRVVGQAATLCKNGNRTILDRELLVSTRVYELLDNKNKSLLTWSAERSCYHGNVVRTDMDDWVNSNE